MRSDMNEWTEIRRKVLVEGASKRSIRRDYRIGSEALEKILANPEPPGYRRTALRPKPRLGQFLGVIDEILEADKTAPVKQRHTARRIFERLRDEYGYTGCSSQVRAAVGLLPGREPPLRGRSLDDRDDQSRAARMGGDPRRSRRRRGDPRPAHAPGDRLQHKRAVLAHARTPGAHDSNLEDTYEGRRKEGPLTSNRRPGTQPTANFDDRRSRKRVITEREFH